MKSSQQTIKQFIKQLKALAHHIKPVVTIGQHGMKPTIDEEIETALDFHQLIKIKISSGDKPARESLANQIAENHHAKLIQTIGNITILYRRNPQKPDLLNKQSTD